MKIVISKLPKSGWWQNGIPKYDDNPAMVEGAIPDLNIVEKERQGLISSIMNSGHEVIEFDFPNELDQNEPKHDFIFIRDSFISDQNGTAVILRAGESQRRVENKIVKIYLEIMGMNIVEIPDEKNIPVFVIPPDDAIGTGKMIGNFAANALPLPGVLIRPNHFTDPSIDEKLMDMGIDRIITATSQFQLSGGSVHCMTNEL